MSIFMTIFVLPITSKSPDGAILDTSIEPFDGDDDDGTENDTPKPISMSTSVIPFSLNKADNQGVIVPANVGDEAI
jgi:hypothetical protein